MKSGLLPFFGLFRQSATDDRGYPFIKIAASEISDIRRRRSQMHCDELAQIFGVERRRPGQQFEENYAQRIDIGSRIERAIDQLFRRGVLRQPVNSERAGQRLSLADRFVYFRETITTNLNQVLAVRIPLDKNSLRFQVSQNNAVQVRRVDRSANL